MSPTARLQVTGRDVESRALTLEFNDCVWDLLEETTDRQQAERAVPAWLWRGRRLSGRASRLAGHRLPAADRGKR